VDKQSFPETAKFAASVFETRQQIVTNVITVVDATLVEIDYSAVAATDLPNGRKAGQELSFSGASQFRTHEGKIFSIVDAGRFTLGDSGQTTNARGAGANGRL
jgi:hypothetical protein